MSWKACSAMSEREEFVALGLNKEGSMSVLCRRFGISRKTGYKWIARFKQGGGSGRPVAASLQQPAPL